MQDLHNSLILIFTKAFLFGLVLFLGIYFSFQQFRDWDASKQLMSGPFVDDGVCNVAVVPISGDIAIAATAAQVDATGYTISSIPVTGDVDRVIHDLEYIKKSEFIKGVILQIDSYGGYGNAATVLLEYLKDYPLPVVALIRDSGTSMGYWVALGGKKIIAYPGADVGSIGVNSSFLSSVEKNEKDGLEYISIVSGKYKDTGVPDKPLSESDLEFLKKQNEKFFDLFVNAVSENRNMSVEDVKQIADGRTWLAEEARDLKLIDEVGDQRTALKWIEKYWGESLVADIASGEEVGTTAIPCPQY